MVINSRLIQMLGDSKALRLREMFRFRSSQRHKQISDNQSGVSNTAKVITPPVPIVRVQCDPSFEAEEEFERELYRVRSFKRTSKGLISLVRLKNGFQDHHFYRMS